MRTRLKICLLSDYPPMEGGRSKTSYWLARRLAQRGHEVHVITDALQAPPDCRLYLEPEDWAMLSYDLSAGGGGRVVLGARFGAPPDTRPDPSRLAALAIERIESEGLELVFSHCLEPYGIAGQLAASLTGLPHLLRQTGSQLPRLPRLHELLPLHRRVLSAVDCVLTDIPGRNILAGWGLEPRRALLQAGAFCPTEFFHPAAEPLDVTGLLRGLPGATGTSQGEIR
ncbi:MAG: glycosyltransferase, partial [Gammaproteobacteria bacterium]